ncbi:hypothetical protein EMPG_14735, partial [Blastomyces silverae]
MTCLIAHPYQLLGGVSRDGERFRRNEMLASFALRELVLRDAQSHDSSIPSIHQSINSINQWNGIERVIPDIPDVETVLQKKNQTPNTKSQKPSYRAHSFFFLFFRTYPSKSAGQAQPASQPTNQPAQFFMLDTMV